MGLHENNYEIEFSLIEYYTLHYLITWNIFYHQKVDEYGSVHIEEPDVKSIVRFILDNFVDSESQMKDKILHASHVKAINSYSTACHLTAIKKLEIRNSELIVKFNNDQVNFLIAYRKQEYPLAQQELNLMRDLVIRRKL